MNWQRILIICLILCIVCSFSAVSAADANADDANGTLATSEGDVVEVSNDLPLSSSSDEGILRTSGTFTELNNIINDVNINDGDTIILNGDYAYVDADGENLKKGIFITKNIIIDGNGHTINGSNVARIFAVGAVSNTHITMSNVILKNINFVNAYNDNTDKNSAFGAVEFWGTGNIDHCNFSNNNAFCAAALAWGTGTNVNITNCIFTDNSGSGSGGGAIRFRNGMTDINIENCTFKFNHAGTDAGAIHVDSNLGSSGCTIYNCTFINNTATGGAGALFFAASNTVINMSRFINNSAESNGGAIYWRGHSGKIINSNFTTNHASNAGALYWTGSDGLVYNCTFTDNYAKSQVLTDGNGGAVYIVAYQGNAKNTTFSLCTFVGNNASCDGGAINWDEGAYDGVIIDSTFTNNYAVEDGGAILWRGSNGTMNHTSFTDNTAGDDGGAICWRGSNGTIYDITCLNNNGVSLGTSSSRGGAICLTGDNVTISDSSFTSSSVIYTDESDASKIDGGAIFITGDNVNVTNTSFKDCSAYNYGGTIHIIGKNALIDNCSFDNSQARYGGILFIQGDNATINLCNLSNGKSENNGGSIYVIGKDTKISYSNFDNNEAEGAGGALFWASESTGDSVKHSNFTNNDAISGSGGAIYWSGGSDHGLVLNSTFENNTAENYGGGIYWSSSEYGTVENCTFRTNVASANGGGLCWEGNHGYLINDTFEGNEAKGINVPHVNYAGGGAVSWSARNGEFTNCTFVDNFCPQHAGAVYGFNSANLTVNNCNFTHNSATEGAGGVFYLEKSENVNFYNSNFTNNYARGSSGCIYFNQKCDDSELVNCTFKGNTAWESSVSRWNIDNGLIYNCTFIGNYLFDSAGSKDHHGGVIDFDGHNNLIDNCRFINNSIPFETFSNANECFGGAIYNHAVNSNITNTTFIGNHASLGGAIFTTANAAHLYNLTFINNTASNGGGIIVKEKAGAGTPSDTVVYNCTFINNTAIYNTYSKTGGQGGAISWSGARGTLYNATFTGNIARQGGAVCWEGSAGELYDCNFTNNNASRTTDSIGGTIYWTGGSGSLHDLSINRSYCTNYAGSIYVSGKLTNLDNINITNSSSRKNAGTIYIKGDNITVSNAILYNCSTNNNKDGGGAAIYCDGANYDKIVNVTIINSTSTTHGGAVYWTGSYGNLTNVNITNVKGYSKVGEYSNGGAIYWTGASGSLTNVTIENSSCESHNSNGKLNTNSYGGAIYWTGASGVLTNVTLINSKAYNSGGAIYWTGNDPIFTNLSVTNASSTSLGGGLYLTKPGTIEKSNFTNCSAENGGAIYTVGSGEDYAVNIFITQSSFKNNKATVEGGAIYSGFTRTQITKSEFVNNTAKNGGAIVIAANNQDILSCNFTGNNATNYGGAVYVKSFTQIRIKDSTFKKSYAFDGGAIYNLGTTGASLYITNDTFIKNLASHNGGAVYYIVDADSATSKVIYRDYDNFDKRGVIDSNDRTTVDMSSDVGTYVGRIFESYFWNNEDYLLNVSSVAATDSRMGIIYIYNPKDAHKRYVNIVINVTDTRNNRLIDTIVINQGNYDDYYSSSLNYLTIPIQGPDVDINTKYNVTISFMDDVYMLKLANTSFTTGDASDIGDFTLLQGIINRAIDDAEGTGKTAEITLLRSYIFTYRDDLDKSCMNITAPIIINGNGWSISAENRCRIFNITSDDVVLNDIRFTNGNASGIRGDGIDAGGAIFWAGENGLINKSIIDGNNASRGGGIYYNATALNCKIYDCNFINNNATTFGGAIDCNASKMGLYNTTFENNFADTGAALCREANATGGSGKNNTFISNHADSAGAALAWIKAENIYIDTYTFTDNTAGYSGGAIYVGIDSKNCTVFNSTFTGNNVTDLTNGHGGAIEWYADTGRTLNSTFINNNAYSGGAIYVGSDSGHINITNSGFLRNNAVTLGGAIYLTASSVAVNNSYFRENTASRGGAIFVGGSATANSDNNYIYSSYFTDNNATISGGAVNWNSTAGHVYKTNFTRNFAQYGGAIYVGGASPNSRIDNVIFMQNNATKNGGAIDWNATGGELYNTQFISNYAGEYGAALCRESGATGGSGKNNTFKYNHAGIAGAALAWMNVTKIHIDDYHFFYNTANASGAAIYIGNGSDNCIIDNSEFEGNNVTNETAGHGGAVDIVANNASVINSNFTNNNAFYGGAIFVGSASGNTNITNSTFTKNSAVVDGGAINLQASGVILNRTQFEENVANNGGAIYVGGIGTTNKIYDSNFTLNLANNNGAAIYWRAYAGHIENTNFTFNIAENNGGAIYLNGVSSNTNITHVIFKYNSANKNGGAIDCNSTKMNLTYTLFESNYAGEYGAALCREKGATSGFGEYNNFTSNNAGIAGAALAWLGVKNININHYIFKDNTADQYGGAIYASVGSDNFTITNCDFTGNNVTNATAGHGGAIDIDSDNNTIKNSNFTNNHAFDGGAIQVGSASGQTNITNVTFTKNGAYHDGGALNLEASGVRLNDTRFYNNTASYNGGAVYVGGVGTTNAVFYSVFNNNEAGNRGGAIDWLAQKGEIKYVNFTKNSARDGGALYLNGESSGSELSHLIFANNTAVRNGGAIDCNATLVNLTHTKFVLNTAEFGAALCRESGAVGGFGVNNTFDKNHATKSGAALAWLGVANIHINNYTFTNNTADYSGGAIYVGPGSDDCSVANCTFEDNYVTNAINGRGGAIDWIGNNGTVQNTTFYRCISVEGGAIYAAETSDNLTVFNSTFTLCTSLSNGGAIVLYGDNATINKCNFTSSTARENGGAIAGFGSDNTNISYCDFKYNMAAGYVDPNGAPYGEGGAIYWTNSKNLNISNSKFLSDGAHLSGGSISADNCSDSVVYNIDTYNETASTNGGSISWINSDNVTIDLCRLVEAGADYRGGSIYFSNVNATVKNSFINSSWAARALAGGIYVDGNVNIDTVKFNSTYSELDNATGIYFASGNSTVVNSTFTNSINTIGIARGAKVNLTENNISATNPNKSLKYLLDNSTSGIKNTIYSVWNDGELYLSKNNFDYVIFNNNGTITSKTYLDVLDNKTWNSTWNETFTFFANITDDNMNTIISVSSLKTWNNHDMGGSFNMSCNQRVLRTYFQEEFIIYGSDAGLINCVNRSGTISVKMPVSIDFDKENIKIYNDRVELTTNLRVPVTSNFTINNQKLLFKIGDQEIEATITSQDKWLVATAVMSLKDWAAGTHTVTAIYDGDIHHLGAINTTSFELSLRESWIKVYIANVNYGQTAIALITTNSNSTVLFNYHGKKEIVPVTMTKGDDGNYTGEIQIPVGEYVTTGHHDAGVVLEENDYYEYHVNQTSFEVYKLNTTVGANPIKALIEVGEKQTITVTVSEDYAGKNASGFINITLNGEAYYKKLDDDGKATLNVYDLPKGNYNNIGVYYEGDDYFNGNSTKVSFRVDADDDYNITVKVDNVTYGQNATIYIVLPISVSNNLTVYVNNTKYENVTVKDGLAIVNVNTTVLNAPGKYVVNVTYPGDDVYALKYKNGTAFYVKATSDWALNLTVEAHRHGENTIFTVIAPNNLENALNFTIDGKEYALTAARTLTLNNLTAGEHTACVKYDGDNKYLAKANSTNFLVDKEDSTVVIARNGETLTATVTSCATGTVTFYVNGKEYTRNVNNGEAVLENALINGNNSVIAVYNGDVNFTSSKDSKNYIKDLETSLVNVSATTVAYGSASEITVRVPAVQSGFVTITVNDTLLNVTVKISGGIGKFNASGLDVGRYIVNVTYLGDSTYGISTNHTYFNITQNNTFEVGVIAQNVTVKENASFVVNITDNFAGKVNITIGGVSYYDGDVKSLIAIDKLPAGTYTADLKFYGSKNYGNKTVENVIFNVYRVTPTINVTVVDVTYPTKSVAIVNVSDYANGTINITVGDKHFAKTITNGHVEIDLTGLSAGVKDALVNFTTSDKYNFNNTVNIKFNINKAKSTVILTQNGQNVIATVTADATGNVTFFINGKKYSKEIDGNQAVLENVLLNGNNTIVAIYGGDENFTSAFNATNNTVALKDAKVSVSATTVVYGNDSVITVTVPAAQKGYVRVTVNGTDIDVVLEINEGTATFNATGLNVARYKVNVTYLGDGTYGIKENSSYFNIKKANLTASVIAQNVTVDENASFIISVLNDFNGNVSIEVNGVKYNGTVKTFIEIEKLIKGAKQATVTFYGDDNYNVKVLEPTFTVSGTEPTINVTVTDTTYPNNATATVKVSGGANGTIEIKVGDHTYSKEIRNGETVINLTGLDAGLKEAIVTFTSSDDYNSNVNASYKFFINKTQSKIEINVTPEGLYAGDDALINISVSCTGEVTVYLDGEENKDILDNNRIILNKNDLSVGDHTVVVYYPGDKNYESSSKSYTFNVGKRDSLVNVTVDSTVPYNEIVEITVETPKVQTGYVTITVNNRNYTAKLKEGVAKFNVTGLKVDKYTVNVTYEGDENYTVQTNDTTFNVTQISLKPTVIGVNVTDAINSTFIIIVPDDYGGQLTITVDGETYTGNPDSIIQMAKLTAGEKTAHVVFGDDTNYKGAELDVTFNVTKADNYLPVTTVVNSTTVVVTVPENVTGNVTVVLPNGTNKTVIINNGSGVITLENMTPGENNITVIYSDGNNTITTNATVTIPKYDTDMDVSVVVINNTAVVTVEVPINATGNITVTVDGKTYTTDNISEGKATITVENLTAGNKTLIVEYSGDGNYSANYSIANFTIDAGKIESEIIVVDHGNGTVVVVIGDNATGNVTIKVGNNTYNATVINGTAVVYINNETPGIHEIEVIYSGDGNHTNATAGANITAPKYDTSMNVTVGEAKEGEPIVIAVEVPVGATGEVIVHVGGENHTATINPQIGMAIVVVDNISGGNHTIAVEYAGDDNYAANYTVSNMTVQAGKVESDLTVVDYGNGTVVVVVGDNATGNVTVKVGDNTYNATVVNGTAVVYINNETPGIHEIEVVYSGDDTHTNANTTANITAPKYDTSMNVTVGGAKEGEPIVITVEVPVGATGEVVVYVGGENHTATIDPQTGKATVTVDNVSGGNHTIAVEYSGDDNYAANYTVSNMTVEAGKVDSDLTVVDYGNGTVVVVVGDNATGNVTVKVGDKEFNATVINGTAVVYINNETPGTHEIEVIYSGDDTHANATATANITAPKYNTSMNVTVGEAKEGEPIVITVEVPVGATGEVVVYVGGENHTATIDPQTGKATVTVDNVSGGNHTIAVEYSGDDNYAANYTVSNMTVQAGKVESDLTVVDYGNGTVVVVVGDNATGNVTVKIGNETYNATVINGTAVITLDNATVGEHNITIIYSGDDTHTNATVNTTITVKDPSAKKNTPIKVDVKNINVGDIATVEVTLPDGISGEVTVEIDGVKYTKQATSGKVTFEIENLTTGIKSVFATYAGDDTYAANYTSGQFNVSKVEVNISVEISDIKVGENATVTITLPKNATGQILIDIDGIGYYANVTDGIAVATIPYLPSGTYDVDLTYTGDEKYMLASNKTSLKVEKIPSFVIPIASNIDVGENEVIKLIVPSDATGNVTVVIDGEEYNFNLQNGALGVVYSEGEKYTVAISGGNGELTVSGLPKGEYTVSVKYNGDKKYLPSTNSTIFTVSKIDTSIEVVDQGNGTVVVILPEDATGNVTITVENQTYTAEVVNGTATVTINNTAPGTHDIVVDYSGDRDYSSKSTNSTVDIPKYETPISVSVDDIKVGETAEVIVSLPDKATGKVTIEINGIEYTGDAKDGKATFEVEGLAYGNKTVAVTYEGDSSYVENFTTGQFEVAKNPSTIKATSKNINVGKDEIISVTVPSDATGRVLVDIDGVGYYGDIVNGKAKVIIPNLEAGKYKATVTYEGDDKYLPSATGVTFTVSKVNAPISASSEEIKQGEEGTVIVKVPDDATGKITILVDGKTYTKKVENGQAIFLVPGLTAGDYDVTAYYSGDAKYDANSTITDIIVIPAKHDGKHASAHEGISLSDYSTGNPILVLLLIVLAIGSTQLRRFRK